MSTGAKNAPMIEMDIRFNLKFVMTTWLLHPVRYS
jgi:hypothetical protein